MCDLSEVGREDERDLLQIFDLSEVSNADHLGEVTCL